MLGDGVSVAPAAEEPKFDLSVCINEVTESKKDETSASESFEDLGEAEDRAHHEGQSTFIALLHKLTLEEKVTLLSGIDFVSSSPVPRLNIPSLKVFSI